MKTDALISMLAADAAPVPRHAAAHRLSLALGVAVPLSLALLLVGYGVRRDWADAMQLPMFWLKLLIPLCIALAAGVILQRLARPGVRLGAGWPLLLGAPVALIWALAAAVWMPATEPERTRMLWGISWQICAASILLMAAPVFVGAIVALRSLAPTRPALAGAAAGTLAGGVGAAVYALHCMELAAPFLAVWYVSGIAATALIGAVLGPRLLRW
ncbi:DUF1109 domain-containing protein [Variovorax sp. LT1R16]|uniref:DUF1109 domain-containing protein n=1 Tax=Variovorax sp. LT1R16 TaxID=3443728 RepID=UPI003F45E451